MSFDFPLMPMTATGVSTGGETAAPAAETGTGDFASLLSGSLASSLPSLTTGAPAPALPVNAAPQIVASQNVVLQTVVAEIGATQAVGPAPETALSVSAVVLPTPLPTPTPTPTLLPMDAPEVAVALANVVPETVTTLPLQTVVADAAPETEPVKATLPETVPVVTPQAKPTEILAPPLTVPKATQAEAILPEIASPVTGQPVPTPVMPGTVPTLAEAPIEAIPAVAAPAVKVADVKPKKDVKPSESKAADAGTDKTAPLTPDAVVSLALVAPPVAPVSQPVAAATGETVPPTPVRNPTPAAPAVPQAPAPQNQAADTKAAPNTPSAPEGQASVAPKFASLLNTASAPSANTPAAAPAVPAASANVQADAQPAKTAVPAPQAAQPVQTQPVQTQPVQTQAQNQAAQVQAQAATRKTTTAPTENSAEIASTPVAVAPSGFSLVSAPVVSDSTGYSPAATPQTPAASLMSQTAVDNINALSVQINKRNAEGATKFTMELHPADLGKVDVALSIGRDGKMTAHMTFDSDMTAATFSARESDLRQQLSATGLKLSDDALSFSTRLKTDATAQSQAQTVNANARSADDSSSGNSPQQQNAFTQADSQQGQQRPHSQHLAQLARSQAAADQAAADADLAALNSAIDASAARLKYRQSASRLALDLSV